MYSVTDHAVKPNTYGPLVTAWLLAVTTGFALLLQYAATGGPPAHVQNAWPSGSTIQPAKEQPTLLVFLHPRCPCSHATVAELARMLTNAPRMPETIVVFGCPSNDDGSWALGPLWQEAGRLRGAGRVTDAGGLEAARFGVTTSGHCLLFEPGGQLAFSGGITPGRGHEGDSRGLNALRTILRDGAGQTAEHAVFGCELILPGGAG